MINTGFLSKSFTRLWSPPALPEPAQYCRAAGHLLLAKRARSTRPESLVLRNVPIVQNWGDSMPG